MNGGRKAGDWICRSCQHDNFGKREACQRCGEHKFGVERVDYSGIDGRWEVKPGDWYCSSCSVQNYAKNSTCFKCQAAKEDSASAVAQSWGFVTTTEGWRSGDWVCTWYGCNGHNYASRQQCFRCSAPRDYGTGY